MKTLRILSKNISDAFKSVFRNFSLSIASISCITITLILVSLSIIMSYNINNFTEEIEKDMTIVVFVERDTDNEDVVLIKDKIENLDNIEDIKFESKETIKTKMQEKSDTFKTIMGEWTTESNPLQDTYLVKVKDVVEIGKTAKEISKLVNIDLVKYGEGMVEELVRIFDNVKKIMYFVVVGLILVTAFLISNTIKVTINSRKTQIEIMRLVGASNLYIKTPYFFEGLLLGLLGSVIPIFLTCYGYIYFYNKFGGKLFTDIIKLVHPSDLMFIIIVSTLIIGVFVGAFGSYRAVRRYLKI